MDNRWRVVSYASRQPDGYKEAAEALRAQCESLNIDYFIPILDFDNEDKKEITLYKPTFIRDQMLSRQVPTLWLDCDASLVGRPRIPWEDGWDVGFVPNTLGLRSSGVLRRLGLRKPGKSPEANPVSAFVVAFVPSASTFHFLEVWKYLCDWPDLSKRHDHARMCWARGMVPRLRQTNVARYLQGKIIRDCGNAKEHDLSGLDRIPLDMDFRVYP